MSTADAASLIESPIAPPLQGYYAPLQLAASDRGSDADLNFMVSVPDIADQEAFFAAGWKSTGYYGAGWRKGQSPPEIDGTARGLCVRASSSDTTAPLASNGTGDRVWYDTNRARTSLELWSADPPAGYVKISDTTGQIGPYYAFVRADLCEALGGVESAWNDHGTGSDVGASVWTWVSPGEGPNRGQVPWRVDPGYDTPTWTPHRIAASAMTIVDETQLLLPF
ncbi:hypothetical protein ITJ44_12945 [Clavibacter sp. VKM Ac-2873]|uniref:hypothetical protein n=1 Tax=Clavibacter sp. VKM Ac-2873 TaxID=2783813 RepID=UPI00188D21D3|nr:hypothetical protein [Clavibacter sp. VKM Ac-2873]MBF4618980.1 hypothetical protein [Clavibacter sp. VKM Ac-2873]